MRQKIQIMNAYFEKEQLILTAEQRFPNNGVKATGQMLVDSDAFSFIYITEVEEDYTYIILSESIWTNLKEALDSKLPVYLKMDELRLELINIHNELQYLIENIKGNRNYGEKMVQKVESTF